MTNDETSATQQTLNVQIMGKDYRIGCPEGEEEGLRRAAQFLNKQMDEIKQSGKVIGTERIAVMAALNFANDLLKKDEIFTHHSAKTEKKIEFLTSKVEQMLLDMKL